MFLQSLHVRNLRSLRDVELDFRAAPGQTRHWTMIIGENGTGKSTLLRAAGLVLAGSEALADLLREPAAWVRNGASQATVEAVLTTAEGNARNVGLTIRRGATLTRVLSDNRQSLALLDKAIARAARNYLAVGYGVSRRLTTRTGPPDKESAFRHPRARALKSLFSADAELHSLEAWAMDMDYRLGAKGIAIVRSTLKGLLPDVDFDRIDRRRRRVLFTTPDGAVPLAQLSDGYQNVAAWVGDLVYRISETFEDYERPLTARGLLIVDELDLHLHPTWQRRLRAFLSEKLPNFQIVATTHSALTAQQAAEHELYYLRREGRTRAPVLHAFPGDPSKLMVHQLLLGDVFGLTTLASPSVQRKREEYRALKAGPVTSSGDRKKMAALQEELQDVPDWSRETKHDKVVRQLLVRIDKSLSTRGSTRRPATPARKKK